MDTKEYWIKDGAIVARPVKADGSNYSAKALFDSLNLIRLETGPLGTSIKWNMACANWSSLLFALNFVHTCTAPFTLRFFNSGWFEEKLGTAWETGNRLEQLIFKSDIYFSQRAYAAVQIPDLKVMSTKLRDALETGSVSDDESVVCSIDTGRKVSHVEQVGRNSLVARIWGVSPVSFPCMSGHSYDRVVSQSYFTALSTGRSVYDHVLAVMVRPDGEHHWMGYQRVIIPETKANGNKRHVRVISDLSPVNINLF
jgi:hypothetical protein